MSLYLIRHLPTRWNQEKKLQGSKDISIIRPDKNTVKVINENKKELESVQFDYVLISELKRTRETAISYGYCDAVVEPLINELNFGEFEGQPKETMLAQVGEDWYRSATNITLGERLKDFENRINNFLIKYRGSSVLVFAHGAVIRAILALDTYGSIDKMNAKTIENNSLTILS